MTHDVQWAANAEEGEENPSFEATCGGYTASVLPVADKWMWEVAAPDRRGGLATKKKSRLLDSATEAQTQAEAWLRKHSKPDASGDDKHLRELIGDLRDALGGR